MPKVRARPWLWLLAAGLVLTGVIAVVVMLNPGEEGDRRDDLGGSGPFTIDSSDDRASGVGTTVTTFSSAGLSTTSTLSLTTTTTSEPPTELELDTEVVVAWYKGWTAAAQQGRESVESYLAGHLYPGLPECEPDEIEYVSAYTPVVDTIHRVYGWTITWGPLNGTEPEGRVYEFQLAERLEDGFSHVTILNGEPYAFFNC